MHMKKIITFLAVALSSAAAHAESTQIFTGGSFLKDSSYGYLGAVTALNGNIGRDGYLLRASGGYGKYTYDRGLLTSDVDGRVKQGDLMVGYQKFFAAPSVLSKGGRITGYIGGDLQDHNLSPSDIRNKVSGNEAGAKAALELLFNFTDTISAEAMGSYSTAFETYWSRGRLGYHCPKATFGPEVSFLGNESFDQQRIGAYIADIALTQSVSLGVAGGYAHASRLGDDSGYGDVSLSINF